MLADIIASVMATLNAGRVTQLATLVGERHIAQMSSPPRIVWVPEADGFGAVQHRGTSPRPVRTRVAGVACHIWAADLAATEQLLHDVVLAIDEQKDAAGAPMRGIADFRGVDWQTENEVISKGAACVLMLAFSIPITAAPSTTTTIAEVAGACSLPNE